MANLKRALKRHLMKGRLLLGGNRHVLVGDEALWKLKRDFQIRFLREHGLRPHHVLLDIGCGTLRGGIPIIEYLDAGSYIGVEVRDHVIHQARRELREAGLEHKQPTLMVSDMRELTTPRPVDIAWAFSALIHMRDDILAACLTTVVRVLADDGEFYANVNIGEGVLGEWQDFPIQQHSLEFYEAQAHRAGLGVESLGTLAELGHQSGKAKQDAQWMLRFFPRESSQSPY